VLGDGFLAYLPTLDETELDDIRAMLAGAEAEISAQRQTVYAAYDLITEEITRRYREGMADGTDLLTER